MSCKFTPTPLLKHLDGPYRNNFELRTGLTLFRDELVRILGTLRVKTITGTLTVSELGIGSSVDVSVDHSDKAVFCFCSYPEFTAIDGVEVEVFAMVDISGTSYSTTGSNWVARISNVSLATYSPSFSLSWSRRGMK